MSAVSVSVGTDWTLLLDLSGKLVQALTITRDGLQTLYVAYTGPNEIPNDKTDSEWIITETAFGIETGRIPSGGKIWAKLDEYSEAVEVNYD